MGVGFVGMQPARDDVYRSAMLQEIDKAIITPHSLVLVQLLSQLLNWVNTMLLGEKLFTLLSKCIVKCEPDPIGSQYHYTLLLSGDCKVFSYWWHILKICHQESLAGSLYPRSLLLPRNLHPSALPSIGLGLTIHLNSKYLAHWHTLSDWAWQQRIGSKSDGAHNLTMPSTRTLICTVPAASVTLCWLLSVWPKQYFSKCCCLLL